MATLTVAQRAEMREQLATSGIAINYTKTQVDAALQAIEDWFEGQRSTVSGAIDAATGGLSLTNAQKKALIAYYMKQKFRREGGQ